MDLAHHDCVTASQFARSVTWRLQGAATKHASAQLERCIRRVRRVIVLQQLRVRGEVGSVADRLGGFAGSKRRSRLKQ
jgi:hypothetical protein